ncbi:hypothetical protein AVEN_47746-1 [Araneus ventricosus]|uniref:Uncharacterized protein n=1 Tax=Araneus ventricosus TaxID=182803 RepID=A0A4Y2K2M7_ARAVE|nr:hypothetical protein AVEN_47746-1 [Araneus ventricosus]
MVSNFKEDIECEKLLSRDILEKAIEYNGSIKCPIHSLNNFQWNISYGEYFQIASVCYLCAKTTSLLKSLPLVRSSMLAALLRKFKILKVNSSSEYKRKSPIERHTSNKLVVEVHKCCVLIGYMIPG